MYVPKALFGCCWYQTHLDEPLPLGRGEEGLPARGAQGHPQLPHELVEHEGPALHLHQALVLGLGDEAALEEKFS